MLNQDSLNIKSQNLQELAFKMSLGGYEEAIKLYFANSEIMKLSLIVNKSNVS